VVRSDDEALLAQAAADRSLQKLGLALVSPGVLTSTQDTASTVAALRSAGYLPMPEDAAGAVVTRAAGPTRPGSTAARPRSRRARPTFVPEALLHAYTAPTPAVDLEALATRLVDAGVEDEGGIEDDGGDPPPPGSTEATLRVLAPRLSPTEVRVLAHAVDEQVDVVIEYDAPGGGLSQRTISEAELVGGALTAWCHMVEDDRDFAVGRIRSVRAVG